jgi:hypothetical protein
MIRVPVDIYEDDVDGDDGIRPGIKLICSRCGSEVEVYGASDASARYGAKRLRENCARGERNRYDVDWWR